MIYLHSVPGERFVKNSAASWVARHTRQRGSSTSPAGARDILQHRCVNSHSSAMQVSYKHLLFGFFCHSTLKHEFIEDLFAASLHSCSS